MLRFSVHIHFIFSFSFLLVTLFACPRDSLSLASLRSAHPRSVLYAASARAGLSFSARRVRTMPKNQNLIIARFALD